LNCFNNIIGIIEIKNNNWNCLVIWGKEVGQYLGVGKIYGWERPLFDKIVRWLLSL